MRISFELSNKVLSLIIVLGLVLIMGMFTDNYYIIRTIFGWNYSGFWLVLVSILFLNMKIELIGKSYKMTEYKKVKKSKSGLMHFLSPLSLRNK